MIVPRELGEKITKPATISTNDAINTSVERIVLTTACTGSPIKPAPGDAGRYASKVFLSVWQHYERQSKVVEQ